MAKSAETACSSAHVAKFYTNVLQEHWLHPATQTLLYTKIAAMLIESITS